MTASLDKSSSVCDAKTGKIIWHRKHHSNVIRTAVFSPCSTRIVTASRDKTAAVCDARTGNVLLRLEHHAKEVTGRLVEGGAAMCVCVRGGGFQCSGVHSKLTCHPPHPPSHQVTSAAYSPDGHWLVTASRDMTAAVCDAKTGTVVLRLEHHSADVLCAVFSPDGKFIATASNDKTVTVSNLFWLIAGPLLRGERMSPPNVTSAAPTLTDLAAVLACPGQWKSSCYPNPATPDGHTAMHIAASHRNAHAIQVLIDAGLPMDARSSTGQTVLHACARPAAGFATIATIDAAVHIVTTLFPLKTFGAIVDMKDNDGSTALSLAVRIRVEHPNLVDCLLACKADPLVVDNSKRAPLHFACFRGHVHCATSLLDNFANVDAEDENGRTVRFGCGSVVVCVRCVCVMCGSVWW